MKLPENSLFATLLRARWWVSALVGLAAFGIVRLLLDAGFGLAVALPFLVISCVVLWRELRAPRGGARLDRAIEGLRAMNAETFTRAVEEGFRRRGYAVKRAGGEADLELEKDGRVSLACTQRWKAARTGVEPLKALAAAGERRAAAETYYLCTGELTEQALAFAAERRIRMVTGPELVTLTRGGG
jgi:restriction system protein